MQLKKRKLLLASVAATFTGSLPALSQVSAGNTRTSVNIDTLITALTDTQRPVCLKVATRLKALPELATSFDLHLRSAGLNESDAKRIAEALKADPAKKAMSLRSFSTSYNPDISDNGAIALIEALPTTVTELGMVDCSLADAAGMALVQWATHAVKLRMICVETNGFSTIVRTGFSTLVQQRPALTVIV